MFIGEPTTLIDGGLTSGAGAGAAAGAACATTGVAGRTGTTLPTMALANTGKANLIPSVACALEASTTDALSTLCKITPSVTDEP
jgi:hypothetical protein